MNAVTFRQFPNRSTVLDVPKTKQSPLCLANRLPRRTLRRVVDIPLSDEEQRSGIEGDIGFGSGEKVPFVRPRFEVAAIPSADRNCRHHLFVEDGPQLKKIDFPSVASIAITQRFDARAGDTLKYEYVVILNARGNITHGRPAVRAIVVNRETELATSLMERSLDRWQLTKGRANGRFRETQTFTVPTGGQYELRFITLVDQSQPGSEAHLLVNSMRLVSPRGQEMKRLVSLSCVGRVYQPTVQDSIN